MSTKTPVRAFTLLVLSASALLWTGCETAAPTSAAPTATTATAATFPRESMKKLRVGMPKATVVELLGEPTEVKKSSTDAGPLETWVYIHALAPVYREVAVEMEEVSYTDPITGIVRTVLDPRQQLERISRKEYFELTFDATDQIVDLDYDLQQTREI